MYCTVYVLLLLPFPATLVAGPLAERLNPRSATWLLTAAAVALAGASTVSLSLLTLAGLARVPAVADLGRCSPRVLQQGAPGTPLVPLLAGALLAAAVAMTIRGVRRRTSALRASSTTRAAACAYPG